MHNNYDNIAFCYDRLSRLVFGKAQTRAQIALLPYIPSHSRVLIVGGGTGWILEEISKLRPEGLDIFYIEISKKMLQLAQSRNAGRNKITFIHQPIEGLGIEGHFDVVLTGFLFDNFSTRNGAWVFRILDCHLKPAGLWLFTDFSIVTGPDGLWQRMSLKVMYVFFRIICNVEATHLTDMQPAFKKAGYRPAYRLNVCRNFILSVVYKKCD